MLKMRSSPLEKIMSFCDSLRSSTTPSSVAPALNPVLDFSFDAPQPTYVRVQFAASSKIVRAFTSCDLFYKVDNILNPRVGLFGQGRVKRTYPAIGPYYLTFAGRPLSRRPIALGLYGIVDYSVVRVAFAPMVGGAQSEEKGNSHACRLYTKRRQEQKENRAARRFVKNIAHKNLPKWMKKRNLSVQGMFGKSLDFCDEKWETFKYWAAEQEFANPEKKGDALNWFESYLIFFYEMSLPIGGKETSDSKRRAMAVGHYVCCAATLYSRLHGRSMTEALMDKIESMWYGCPKDGRLSAQTMTVLHEDILSALDDFEVGSLQDEDQKFNDCVRENWTRGVCQGMSFGEALSKARTSLDVWTRFQKSGLWKKFKTVMAYVTICGLAGDCDQETAKKVALAHGVDGKGKIDMVHSILDFALFLCERGYQIYLTHDLSTIFHSGATYDTWYVEAAELVAQSQYINNPEAHGIDMHTFQMRVEKCVTTGKNIQKYGKNVDSLGRDIVGKMMFKILEVKASLESSKSTQAMRKAPFSVVVEGHSAVAKSTFAKLIDDYYAVLRHKDNAEGHRYVRNSAAKFWDGFKTHMWSLLIDDVCYARSDKIMGIDPTLDELIMIRNPTPHCPDMAAIEDKGKTPVKSELLVVTTNSPYLNLFQNFETPFAIARRFPYHIRVKPRVDLRDPKDPVMLMHGPPRAGSGCYEDWWDISVFTPVAKIPDVEENDPREFKAGYELELLEFEGKKAKDWNMAQFLPWLAKMIEDHNVDQEQVVKSNKMREMVSICLKCKMPQGMCHCELPVLQEPFSTAKLNVQGAVTSGIFYLLIMMCGWYMKSIKDDVVAKLHWTNILSKLWKRWSAEAKSKISDAKVVSEMAWYWCGHTSVSAFEDARFYVRMFGEKVREKIGTSPLLKTISAGAGVAFVAVTATAIWKYFASEQEATCCHDEHKKVVKMLKRDRCKCDCKTCLSEGSVPDTAGHNQGIVSSSLGKMPEVSGERENVWFNSNPEISHLDLSKQCVSWKALSESEINTHIVRNVVRVELNQIGSSKSQRHNALGLGGQWFACNIHQKEMQNLDEVLLGKLIFTTRNGITRNVGFSLTKNDVRVHDDLLIFRVRSVPPLRNIMSLIPSERVSKAYFGNGTLIGRDVDTNVWQKEAYRIVRAQRDNPMISKRCEYTFCVMDSNTVAGDCGAVLWAQTKCGPIVLGLHQWGGDAFISGSITLTKERLHNLIGDELLVDEGIIDLSKPDGEYVVQDLAAKSPVRYVESGEARVYGSFQGFRTSPKSHVKKTFLCDYMEAKGYALRWGSPTMRGWLPWRRTLLELSANHHEFDNVVIDKCVDALVNDWKKVPEKWKQEICMYDDVTVVNGRPGMRYIDSINRSTSAGFPWKHSKRSLMKSVDLKEFGLQDAVEVTQEVQDRVDDLLVAYMEGRRGNPIFVASLKDKALPYAKIAIGKTRVFMGSCLPLTLAMRKMLLSFVRVVQKNKFLFEQAPGTEAQAVEWDLIYHHITRFGKDRCVFGDFSGFDATMSSTFILAAFDAIVKFHEWCGADAMHIKMIKTLAYDVCFYKCDFNGDLVEFFGKNPSGQALTVIINGIVNCLYMRYVYYTVAPHKDVAKFQQDVSLLTYGDDNGMSVREGCDWFNHTSITRVLSTIGVKYTMADKHTESIPLIPVEKGSFLKRTWRFEQLTQSRMCPLEEDSIIQSLMIGCESKFLSDEVQATSLIENALQEYFFYGKEKFEERKEFFEQMISNLGLENYVRSSLPTFDGLLARYCKNSRAFLKEANDDIRSVSYLPDPDHYVLDHGLSTMSG